MAFSHFLMFGKGQEPWSVSIIYDVMRMKDSVYVPPTPPKVWGLLVLLPGCGGLGSVSILQVRDDLMINRKPLGLFGQGFGNHVLVWPWILSFSQKTILRCESVQFSSIAQLCLTPYKSVWEQGSVFLPLISPYSEWCNGMSSPDVNHVAPPPWDQIDLSQCLNPMTWGDSPGLLWFPCILLSLGPLVFIVHLCMTLSGSKLPLQVPQRIHCHSMFGNKVDLMAGSPQWIT